MTRIPVFDGHNDVLYSLRETGRSFFARSEAGHIDLPRSLDGGMVGGFFAIWVPNPAVDPYASGNSDPNASPYSSAETMQPQLGIAESEKHFLESLATLAQIERESGGAVSIVRNTADIRRNLKQGVLSVEIHLEGAESIDPTLNTLEAWYLAGMRSIGITWSRPNAFGSGVPFQFPASPDTGPGLTNAGKALVSACNNLGVLIDLSHLNEAGFWDVARLSKAPLVATHSGVHAICPTTRNLTDRQLDAVRDSDGIVGVNFHVGFIRPDGVSDPSQTTVAAIADHVDYLVGRLGADKVAFGSDFDGATMPGDLLDVAGLPLLIEELFSRGYDEATLNQLGTGNWLRVLDLTWKA